MKKALKYFLVFFFILNIFSCRAQYLMQNLSDAHKLIENKNLFIGKSLAYLLNQIKPDIKMVVGMPGGGESPNYFRFLFVTKSTYEQYKSENKNPLTIKVIIKESFTWDLSNRPPGNKFFVWTKKDESKFGNLTVEDVIVSGNN